MNRGTKILATIILVLTSFSLTAQMNLSESYCDNIVIVSYKIIDSDKGAVLEVTLKNNGLELLTDTDFDLSLILGPYNSAGGAVNVNSWPGFGSDITLTFPVSYIGIGVPDDLDIETIEQEDSGNNNDSGIGIGVPDDMDISGMIKIVNGYLGLDCTVGLALNSSRVSKPCLRMTLPVGQIYFNEDAEIEIPLQNMTTWEALYPELSLEANDHISIKGHELKIYKLNNGVKGLANMNVSTSYTLIDKEEIYTDKELNYTLTLYKDSKMHLGCECEGSIMLRRNETGGIINADELLVETKLYPNPVKDVLYINFTKKALQNVSIIITDLSGREFLSNNITDNTTEVDVREFPKGIYNVSIISDESIKTDKIIIR